MSKSVLDRIGIAVLVIGVLVVGGWAWADVKLPALISDNMVLQRDVAAPIWGWADVGEKVTVKLGAKEASSKADHKGKWMVKLDPLEAGGPFEMTVTGKNTITIKNILVGDVWVCSGQSNMAMAVGGCSTAKEAIAEANYPEIRLFKVDLTPSVKPREDVNGAWQICTPETVPGFSAAGYFFGRELHKALHIPVGLIQNSWGGTPAQAYTSLAALESEPELKPIADQFKETLKKYPDLEENFYKYFEEWDKQFRAYRNARHKWMAEAQKARTEGKKLPPPPKPPASIPASKNSPSVLYNGMVAPLMPFAIKGAIWYQGESDAGRAYLYRALLSTMIKCWRKGWGQGDFPFLFVQLPNFREPQPEPSESSWAEIREAFVMTLSLPNTGMAVTIDLGDAKDIHPKNKEDVGKRLALCALGKVYGKDIVYSGPIYESMQIKGNTIRLKFKNVGGGLAAKGGGPLKQFAIAGADKKFVWADAKIDGDTVIVWSDKVAKPVAVRYAWADNPEGCNLYNKEGLPASPFRTDDWPGMTAPKE